MERPAPFDLSDLRRDWIAGTEGKNLLLRVRRRVARIDRQLAEARARGVLINESDPVRFCAAFFAAVHRRVPAIVAKPHWGRLEWSETAAQVHPAFVFGPTPPRTSEPTRKIDLHPGTVLIPTGGTTRGVRFAVHTWDSFSAAVDGLLAFIGPGPVESCCVLPLHHVSGLMQVLRSFISGGGVFFPDFSDLQAGRFPAVPPATLCLSLVPTQLQRLVAQRRIAEKLALCRVVFLGGAPAPDSLLDRVRTFKIPLVPCYGMTETAAMVTALPPDEFLSGITNAGRPLAHGRVQIICPNGRACPVGHSGRIRVSGPSLCRGIHGQPRSVTPEGLLTDDEGYIDPLGRLHVVGRVDRMIISGGEKIDPAEIENVLCETGGIRHALVIGWPDPHWGQRVVAFYVTAGIENEIERWEREIRSELSHYKVPKTMIHVPRLPLDERGKVDHRRVQTLIASRLGQEEDPRA